MCDYERRKQNEAIILKDTQSIRSPKIERKRIGKRGKIFFNDSKMSELNDLRIHTESPETDNKNTFTPGCLTRNF